MLGRLSTDCTTTECAAFTCYEECLHRTQTYAAVQYRPFGSQAFFGAFVDAWVKDHESILKAHCEYEPEASEVVARSGLPVRIITGYSLDSASVCCESGQCCNEVIAESTGCMEVSEVPNIIELLNAVKCVQNAGWDGIQSVLDVIGGEVLGVSNGAYNVSLPTEYLHLSALMNLILPVPAGMAIKLYSCQ